MGAEFELTLTAPGTGEKFQRTQAGTVWDHLVFSNCFAADGKGAVVAVVRFPETKDEYTLRSFGPAEDLNAIQTYKLQKTFPKLYKNLVDGAKNSADVKVEGIEWPAKANEIDPIPRGLRAGRDDRGSEVRGEAAGTGAPREEGFRLVLPARRKQPGPSTATETGCS